jgi:hypothetical protein
MSSVIVLDVVAPETIREIEIFQNKVNFLGTNTKNAFVLLLTSDFSIPRL